MALVLPPDGSYCWRRRYFPPLSLAVNLFWKLWLQLASVASAISLVIFGEPRKNDSCFFNEFSYYQMSPGICSQLWTGRGCPQQLHHSQFLSLFFRRGRYQITFHFKPSGKLHIFYSKHMTLKIIGQEASGTALVDL